MCACYFKNVLYLLFQHSNSIRRRRNSASATRPSRRYWRFTIREIHFLQCIVSLCETLHMGSFTRTLCRFHRVDPSRSKRGKENWYDQGRYTQEVWRVVYPKVQTNPDNFVYKLWQTSMPLLWISINYIHAHTNQNSGACISRSFYRVQAQKHFIKLRNT